MTRETPQRAVQLQVLVTTEELALIEDFRFRVRLPTRAAAVRELLRRGLTSKEERSRDACRAPVDADE
jgi:hypothetical protein